MRAVLTALALSSAALAAAAAPRLIAPSDLGGADPAAVRLTGLKPGGEVELVSTRRTGFPERAFTARARFKADGRGRLDLATAAPRSGDYAGVDKSGLFWSAEAGRAPLPSDPAPGHVRIEAIVDGQVVGAAEPRTGPDRSSLYVEPVPAFPGAVLARPAGPGRRPVVIVLGGSEGGSATARGFALRFASLGYAAFGLPYYDPGYNPTDRLPGLPSAFQDIPVDRLAAVRDWLAARPDVTPSGSACGAAPRARSSR